MLKGSFFVKYNKSTCLLEGNQCFILSPLLIIQVALQSNQSRNTTMDFWTYWVAIFRSVIYWLRYSPLSGAQEDFLKQWEDQLMQGQGRDPTHRRLLLFLRSHEINSGKKNIHPFVCPAHQKRLCTAVRKCSSLAAARYWQQPGSLGEAFQNWKVHITVWRI